MTKYLILPGLIILFVTGYFVFSTGPKLSPEEEKYVSRIESHRNRVNDEMKNDPSSPFNAKGKIHFENLKYFDVDPGFVFKSKLIEYDKKDTITVYGTKGEPRKAVKFGYIEFNYKNTGYKMNVYKGTSRTGAVYYSLWFTDRTTNDETYGVGRYLDFEKNENPDYVYTIDFNLAYNPYCAYSPNYSCAIPTKDDYVDLAIRAGEKKFHK